MLKMQGMTLLCNKRKVCVFFLSLQLCTKIIEKNANPEWNQVLNLQVKVGGPKDGKLYFNLAWK